MKTMLILGGDRIAEWELENLKESDSLVIVIDRSTSIKRAAKLILGKRLSAVLILKMIRCEFRRFSSAVPSVSYPGIANNKDLLVLLKNMHQRDWCCSGLDL